MFTIVGSIVSFILSYALAGWAFQSEGIVTWISGVGAVAFQFAACALAYSGVQEMKEDMEMEREVAQRLRSR